MIGQNCEYEEEQEMHRDRLMEHEKDKEPKNKIK
jgi:hypothetical protein